MKNLWKTLGGLAMFIIAALVASLSIMQMPGPGRRIAERQRDRRLRAFLAAHPMRGGAVATRCETCEIDLTPEEADNHVCPTTAGANKVMDRLTQVADALTERAKADEARIAEQVDEKIQARIDSGDLKTPTMREDSIITSKDRFDMMRWDKGDFEVAMMMFEASHNVKNPQRLQPPEDLINRWHRQVTASGEGLALVDGENGKFQRAMNIGSPEDYANMSRAMDTLEGGFGLELIGTQYASQLWEAARNEDTLVNDIRQIPMTAPSTVVPIDGALPEMLFVGESTAAGETAYATSKTGSNKVTLDAKKFTIQQIWSGELTEDSIIQFVPFLRSQLAASAAAHLGSAYYNGDDTNAGTGNINSDDADPADTKHYLAFNGIRHVFLQDATGQGKDMNGVLNPDEIWKARGKLSGQGDDIDAELKTINWGKNPRDLRLIMDWQTFMAMHRLGEVLTVDKYGANATVISGELGSYAGIPIISPSYASRTEADGRASGTESNNTKGQITLMNPAGYLGGVRRDMQFFMDRIQRTDQFLIELYTRIAFTKHGTIHTAGIFNITV